ncbi:MFS transporter [Paenibacillus sp. UNC451MF]|uniref:MFS transporter n=1 Tax=Paenibacillus sp. UNC451MF TaxID=1449063 RepID=UPI0007E8B9FC|nr:MFS transporter [Paenibacillus sp. UNC451MF]
MNVKQASSAVRSVMQSFPRDALFFLTASFVNSTGKAVMWPLTTLYVHNVMGKSYGEAGLIVLYQALFSVLGEFVGGNLYYRIGPKAMISGSFTLSSLALFAIAFTDSWPIYIMLVCLLGFTNGISMPSMNAYVGFRWKEHRRKLYNVMYVCNNFGLSIGAMVGGLIASISFKLTYMLTGSTTLLFAIFLFFFMKESSLQSIGDDAAIPEKEERKGTVSARAEIVQLNRGQLLRNIKLYLFISIGSMFFWLSFTQWSTGVAPYIEEQGMDLKFYSLLWTVNGIVILVGQPFTSWIKRRFAQNIVRQMLISALFSVSAFSFILFFHELYIYLIIGMILATLGEMMLLPAIPTFFSERSGVHAPFYMGLAGGFANVGRMIGPLMFGHAFDLWGIGSVFFLGTLSSLAALVMFYIHSNMNKDPDPVPEVKLRTLPH